MEFLNYKQMFKNSFQVNIEVLKTNFPFDYTVSQVKYVSSQPQKINENIKAETKNQADETEIKKEVSETLPVTTSVEYEIKNITPKKPFWRK